MIYVSRGTRLAFDDQGSGEAVLFVHGHVFNRSMWLPQIEALRTSFRTIAPDLRGYGDSDTSPTALTTLEDFSADLVTLLDVLGIAKATVVGLSMGGQIAMEFARAFPHRLAGLVLAATFPRAETSEGAVERNRISDRLIAEGLARFGSEMLPKLLSNTSMKHLPNLAANVYRMICMSNPAGAAAANRGRALRIDYSETLSVLGAPSLVVVGTEDAYTTVDEAREMHSRMSNSHLEVFEEVGHMPNLEDPQRFNSVLLTFLSGLPRTA